MHSSLHEKGLGVLSHMVRCIVNLVLDQTDLANQLVCEIMTKEWGLDQIPASEVNAREDKKLSLEMLIANSLSVYKIQSVHSMSSSGLSKKKIVRKFSKIWSSTQRNLSLNITNVLR